MPRVLGFLLVCALVAAGSPLASAQEPLHQQIDALIAASAGGEINGPATDAEFARRVYLDLVGRIPTREEAQRFLDDAAADKRAKLVDALLASPEYAPHQAAAFHVMLTERLGEHEEWQKWLVNSFAANKPWDQMAREMLAPHYEETDPARGAGFFISKRLENYGQNPVDYPALVRDVGRLMLGVDLQCAQCHDHLLVNDYKQVDYQGLYAYFANVSLRPNVKFPAVQEKLFAKKIEFQSVFVKEKHEVGPRLPFGMEATVPTFEPGQEFDVPPDRAANYPGVPKFSPLKVLASDLPKPATPNFSKNMANRLWWLMMGRGLVHPLDLHHSANPPSHPELMERLAADFTAHQYDIRYLLREIALSQTYQRSSTLPEKMEVVPETSYRVALEKGLSPEQFARSLWTATGPWPDAKPLAELQTRCVKALGQPPREPETEFAPGVKGALFLSHDSAVLELVEKKDGNLIDRLSKLDSPEAAANELYLAILSRAPTDDERADIVEFMKAHSDREQALRQLAWAMLSSSEFALNH
jgi:hypothetical protein